MRIRALIVRYYPFAVLLAVALFLRLYHLPDTIRFRADQGQDLLIIRLMEEQYHRPLVGPLLSIPTIFSAPTYYYLTWIPYALTESVRGIVYAYAAANIVTMIVMMKLAFDVAGRRAALIMGMLFGVSYLMIEHSRTFWAPYPMQFFLACSLLALWHAFKRKSASLLWVSVFFYQFALSVYPSPVLLLPYVWYQLFRWYRSAGYGPVSSVIRPGICLFLTFAIVFSPQIYYEASHSFVSLKTLFEMAPGIRPASVLTNLTDNILCLTGDLLQLGWIPDSVTGFGKPLILGVIVLFVLAMLKNRPAEAFLIPKPLLIGIGFLAFYQADVFSHRMWSLLPLLFLMLSVAIGRALNSTGLLRIAGYLLLALFTASNFHSDLTYIIPTADNGKTEARTVARIIAQDMQSRGLSVQTAGIFHKVPDDPMNGSFDVYRILYFLHAAGIMKLEPTDTGNDLKLNYSSVPETPYLYLVCYRYPHERKPDCLRDARFGYPYSIMKNISVGASDIYVLERGGVAESNARDSL